MGAETPKHGKACEQWLRSQRLFRKRRFAKFGCNLVLKPELPNTPPVTASTILPVTLCGPTPYHQVLVPWGVARPSEWPPSPEAPADCSPTLRCSRNFLFWHPAAVTLPDTTKHDALKSQFVTAKTIGTPALFHFPRPRRKFILITSTPPLTTDCSPLDAALPPVPSVQERAPSSHPSTFATPLAPILHVTAADPPRCSNDPTWQSRGDWDAQTAADLWAALCGGYGAGTGRTPTVTPLSYVPHSYSESSVSSSSGTGSSRSGYAYPMAEEFKPECFLNKYGSIRDDPTPSWVWVWQEGNLSWTSLSRCYNRHCYHNGPLRIQGDKDENGREIPVKATVPVDRGVLV
ncbi:hypothetical protein V8E52_000833 [Russula decolorans]